MEKRKATYLITVPMQITFVAENDLTASQFQRVAEREVLQRLANGYFDVNTDEIDIKKKFVHYTAKEKRLADLAYEEFLKSTGFRGRRGLRGD